MKILYLDKELHIPSYRPVEYVHIGYFDFILDTK